MLNKKPLGMKSASLLAINLIYCLLHLTVVIPHFLCIHSVVRLLTAYIKYNRGIVYLLR